MRLTPAELFLANLKQEFSEGARGYMPKEDAYLALKKLSGKDFEYDIVKWEEWVQQDHIERLEEVRELMKHFNITEGTLIDSEEFRQFQKALRDRSRRKREMGKTETKSE